MSMQPTCALLAGFVVSGLSFLQPAVAAAPNNVGHPRLLITRAMISEIRQKIETESWAAGLWNEVIKVYADRPMNADPGRYEIGIAYALTGHKIYADKLRKLVLDIVKQPADKISWQWGPRPVHAVVMYDLGHDLFTAEEHTRIQTYFRIQAKTEMKVRLTRSPTPNMSAHAHMSVGLIGFCLGDQELIDWALDDERSGGFRVTLQGVAQSGGRMSDDGLFWQEATWNYASGALGYWMTLAEVAANNGVDLFSWKARDGHTLKDFIDGYFRIAFPLEDMGVNRGTIRVAAFGNGGSGGPFGGGFMANATYDGTPMNSDARSFPAMASLLELAYRHYRDPAYAWMIGLNPKRNDYWYPLGFAAFTHGVKLPEKIAPPDAHSGIYPGIGLAMLRSVEGADYWKSRSPVVFHKAARDFPHGHKDFYQIVMHAYGRLIYPDLITASGSYEQHPYVFARRSCGHNTIAIDGRDLEPSNYTMRGDFTPELKFAVSRGETTTHRGDMASLSRALFLTREYLADFFSVASEQPHVYDWYLHGLGRLKVSGAENFKASNLLKGGWPVQLIHAEKRRSPAAEVNWRAEWIQQYAGIRRGQGRISNDWFDRQVGVRMSMLGENGTTVFQGQGPYTAPLPQGVNPQVEEGALPLVVARRTSEKTTFVAVHEPFQPLTGRPRIKAISRLLGDASATGVMIEARSFRDFAAIVLKDREQPPTLWSKQDHGERIEFDKHAYIRISGDKIVARGGITRFVLYAPKLTPQNAVVLNGKAVPYRLEDGYAYYGKVSREDLGPARIRLQELTVSDPEVVPGQTLKIRAAFRLPGRVKVGIEGHGDWGTGVSVKTLGPGLKTISRSVQVPETAAPGAIAGFYAYTIDEAGEKHRLAGQEVVVVPEIEIRSVRGCRLDDGASGQISVRIRSRLPGRRNIGIRFAGLPAGILLDKHQAVIVEVAEEEERQLSLKVAAQKNALQRIGKLHQLAAELVYKDVLEKHQKRLPISFPLTVGLAVIEETVQTKERLGPSVIVKPRRGYRVMSSRYEARFTEQGVLTSLLGPRDFEQLPPSGKLLDKRTIGDWTLYPDRLERPLRPRQQDTGFVAKADRAIWADGMERSFHAVPSMDRGEHDTDWVYLQQDKRNHGFGLCWLPIDSICNKRVWFYAGTGRVVTETHHVRSPKTMVIVPGPRKHAIALMDQLLLATASKTLLWMTNFEGQNVLRQGGFESARGAPDAAHWRLTGSCRLNEKNELAAAGRGCLIMARNGSQLSQSDVSLASGKKTLIRFRYRSGDRSQLGITLIDSSKEVMKCHDMTVRIEGSDDNWHRVRDDVLKQTRPDQQTVFLSNDKAAISNWATVTIACTIETGETMAIEFQNRCAAAARDQRIWIDDVFIGQGQ